MSLKTIIAVFFIFLSGSLQAESLYNLTAAEKEAVLKGTKKYGCFIQREIERMGLPIPPSIIIGQMARESTFDEEAKGKNGELGILQIKPSTAADVRRWYPNVRLTDDLFDWKNNVRTTLYLHNWALYGYKDGTPFFEAGDSLLSHNLGTGGAEKWIEGNGNAYAHPYVDGVFRFASAVPIDVCTPSPPI